MVFTIIVCCHASGAIFSFAAIDMSYACTTLSIAHAVTLIIDKVSADRLDLSVYCCADLIRELVMVLDRLLTLSSDR